MQENEEKPSPKTTNQNKTQNTYLNIRLQTTEFLEVNPGQKIHSIGFGSDFLDLVGFPGGSEVKASACNVGDLGSITGSGRSPEDINGNPLQYSCLGNPMEDPLEKEMETHSSILAWEIPWTEDPGGLQPMGLQSRTRLRDFTFTFLDMTPKAQANKEKKRQTELDENF